MTQAASIAGRRRHRRHQVTLIANKPSHTVEKGAVQFGRLFRALGVFGSAALILLYLRPSYATFGILCCGVISAFRVSRLHGEPDLVREAVFEIGFKFFAVALAILLLQLVAGAMDGIPLIGFLARWFYFFAATALIIGTFFSFGSDTYAREIERAEKSLPSVIVSIEHLRERKAELALGVHKLKTPTVFSAKTRALADAWGRKDTAKIEQLLKAGHALTRLSWEQGLEVYNLITESVDLVRGRLRYLLDQSETALIAYNIDYDKIDVNRSQILVGYMSEPRIKKSLSQKLNYTPAASKMFTEATMGRIPWQLAPVAIAGVVVMHFINKSKHLRQLKEMEGEMTLSAEAVKGDFKELALY